MKVIKEVKPSNEKSWLPASTSPESFDSEEKKMDFKIIQQFDLNQN